MTQKKAREAICKIISIEEARAAARAGRRRPALRKSSVKISSERKLKDLERWLKEIYPELAGIQSALRRTSKVRSVEAAASCKSGLGQTLTKEIF